MTDAAARVAERGRRSAISAEQAWERLTELSKTTDWDTSWLEDQQETATEQSTQRR